MMRIIGYCNRGKKYSSMVYNIIGDPVLNRQRFASSIADAEAQTREDMKEYPFACAVIYYHTKKGLVIAREITHAGKTVKRNDIVPKHNPFETL